MTRFSRICITVFVYTLLILTGTVSADCPHCYDIIRVRVEFTDGTYRQGFFEFFGAQSIVTDSAGNELVSLEGNPYTRRPAVPMRIIDTVYNFEGITHAACSSGIHLLDTTEIDRIIFLDKIPYSGALGINVYDSLTINLLGKEYIHKYEFDDGSLQSVIYLNYNPKIAESTLVSLAEFHRQGGDDLDRRYGRFGLRLKRIIDLDYSEWSDAMLDALDDDLEYLQAEFQTICRIANNDSCYTGEYWHTLTPINAYLNSLSYNLKRRIRFLEILKQYLEGGGKEAFVKGYREIYADRASILPFGFHSLTSDPEENLDNLLLMIDDYYWYFSLNRINIQGMLPRLGIVIVKNAVD